MFARSREYGAYASFRLTPDPDTDWVPRAAPGGGRVAFVSERDGNSEIYVIDFDGTNERRLTNSEHEEWYPSWSPSGARLAFSSDRDGDHEILVMDVDGSYVTQLTYNDDWDSHPAYSPDGRQIVFTKWTDADGDTIWIMNADSSGQRRLIAKPAGADDYYPAWSPDGKKIVFTRYDPAAGNDDIWEYTLASGAVRNLTNNPAGDWVAVVSPDGQWIAFSSNRTGDEEVWLMPAAGGAPQNISQNPLADDRYPDFFWPRIAVQKSVSAAQVVIGAPWQQASTWLPPGVPTQWDRVLIPAAMTVSITDGPPTGPRKVIRHLTVNGTLNGSCDVPVEAPRGITVGAGGLIEAGNQWYTQKGCAVDLRAWPDGTMTINGTVLGISPARRQWRPGIPGQRGPGLLRWHAQPDGARHCGGAARWSGVWRHRWRRDRGPCRPWRQRRRCQAKRPVGRVGSAEHWLWGLVGRGRWRRPSRPFWAPGVGGKRRRTGGWSWHLSPGSLSLGPMAEGVVVATAAIPAEAVRLSNQVTFSARSAADPSQVAVVDLSLYVTEIWQVYLPLILRNFGP